MSIENIYKELILEQYIQKESEDGTPPDSDAIVNKIEELNELDFSIPQFSYNSAKVVEKEVSSANKFNNSWSVIRQDLRTLYKQMIILAQNSVQSLERWNVESLAIEKQLIDIEEDIDNLLLLLKEGGDNTETIWDNFTDSSLIDNNYLTAEHNIKESLLRMTPNGDVFRRLFLNNLDPLKDVQFKLRTVSDVISRQDAENSDLTNPFKQFSDAWWTNIILGKIKPVTGELLVKLSDVDINLSKIYIELHDSSENGLTTITPLYSLDNITFQQLPTTTYTQDVKSKATFTFSTISAKWIKFLFTKNGPDSFGQRNVYNYQFGFKNIEFYELAFDNTETQEFISTQLSITDVDGNLIPFERISLETCEKIETDTDIKYYISTSYNSSSTGLSFNPTTTEWFEIAPTNRVIPNVPIVLDVANSDEIEIGINETLTISYDGRNTNTNLINPSATFNLVSKDLTTGEIVTDLVSIITTPTVIQRYAFQNSNERILNYQIKDSTYTGSGSGNGIDFLEQSLVLFRNKGEKGLYLTDSDYYVRGIQRGWGFEDPFYYCVVEIQNPEGITIDFGNSYVIIDEKKYTNVVGPNILTGKTNSTTGIHKIKVHKNNWFLVEPELNSLSELKSIDKLYPYNHKLLIEGYSYGTSYTDEELYIGVDLFAEYLASKISIFDLCSNASALMYQYYSIDRDAPYCHQGTDGNPDEANEATVVFVVKVDESRADFQNEQYVLRFKMLNNLQRYIRFKAVFETESTSISPELHGYKLKLSR